MLAMEGAGPHLLLHPIHSSETGVGGFARAPRPLRYEVANEAAADPDFGMAAAHKALAIAGCYSPIDTSSCWKAFVRGAPLQHEMHFQRRAVDHATQRSAAHFLVGPSEQDGAGAVLAIPLFWSSLAYRLPPPGVAFNECDTSTWPVVAVGVPLLRVAAPFFDREAQLDAQRIQLAPPGSAFVILARCTSAEFLELVFDFSAAGAIRPDVQNVGKLTDIVLGSGSCARVMLANPVSNEDDYFAAKVPHDGCGPEAAKSFAHEVALTSAVGRHPNLICCHGVFLTGPGQQLTMLMDCHALGDLKFYMARHGTFEVCDSFVKFAGVLSGLVAIHEAGILHRDIKPENLLVSCSGDLIITDFGVACKVDDVEAMKMRCGTVGHFAPEVLEGLPYDCKVDVFGAGVIFYYLLTAWLPFVSKSETGTMNKNLRAKVHLQHPALQRLSLEAQDFVLHVLERCPQDRPTSRVAWEICAALPESSSGELSPSEYRVEQPEVPGLHKEVTSTCMQFQTPSPQHYMAIASSALLCDRTSGVKTRQPWFDVPNAHFSSQYYEIPMPQEKTLMSIK